MNVVLKRMPGSSDGRVRCLFSENPGERPMELFINADISSVEKFLVGKLETSASTAARVAVEVIGQGGSFLERVPLEQAEVRLLLKLMENERLAAENSKSKGTVQPREATQ